MGQIIWINGLAGAGKSTTARALCARLEELQKDGKLKQKGVIYIDGDDFRGIIEHSGYDKIARIDVTRKKILLCVALAKQGYCVVHTAISLFNECYEFNRKICEENDLKYFEIFVNCPMEILEQRDQKGLYSGVKAGKQKDVVGIDIAYDDPNADLEISATQKVENNVDIIIQNIFKIH